MFFLHLCDYQSLHITSSNCRDKIKFSFIDLDFRIREYHGSLLQRRLLAIDWTSSMRNGHFCFVTIYLLLQRFYVLNKKVFCH